MKAATGDATQPGEPAAQHGLEIYLLRHAHAGNPDEWTGDDADRPLSPKGRQQAQRLGQFLADRGFTIDAIVTSPKLRALQTAELVAPAIGARHESDQRLARPIDIDRLRTIVQDAGGTRVMLVGHEPDFSNLCAELIGAQNVPLKKGALARLDSAGPLGAGSAVLRWLVPPDLIARA